MTRCCVSFKSQASHHTPFVRYSKTHILQFVEKTMKCLPLKIAAYPMVKLLMVLKK